MSILMPSLALVKDRARTVGCMANLKQWALVAAMYAQDNDGKYWSGVNYGGAGTYGYFWPWQLEDQLKDWKTSKMWFCPSAKKPIIDENGNSAPTFNIWNAWGIFKNDVNCQTTHKTYKASPNGMSGSYTINGYILDIRSLAVRRPHSSDPVCLRQTAGVRTTYPEQETYRCFLIPPASMSGR